MDLKQAPYRHSTASLYQSTELESLQDKLRNDSKIQACLGS